MIKAKYLHYPQILTILVIFSMFLYIDIFKVTHRVTGEVMVLKELYKFDKEAHESFLKEVFACLTFLRFNIVDLSLFFHA